MTGVPEGWAEVLLGDLIELRYGKALPERVRRGGSVAVYGANGVVGCHDTALLTGPTILVGRKGSVGAVHYSSGPCWPIDTTYFIEEFGALDPRFLVQVLKSLSLAQHESSTAIPGLNREDVYAQVVRLPPLAEQRRIVAKVDALVSQIQSALERLGRLLPLLKRLRQSVLAAACSGELTREWRMANPESRESARQLLGAIHVRRRELGLSTATKPIDDAGIESPDATLPEQWTWCRVGEVADVRLGGTPTRTEASYWNGSVPWVSSGEVANCRIRDTQERITRMGLENSNAKMYPAGTVLIAMIGEGKTRGQAAILDVEACTNQNVAGLVFDAGMMNPEYVWYWALSEYAKNREAGRGGNQAALNGGKVRALFMPLPPFEEQAEVVRLVKEVLAVVDDIESRVHSATKSAVQLRQAILVRALSGALVPTEAELATAECRDFESAEALLARLPSPRRAAAHAEAERISAPRGARRQQRGSMREAE